MINNYLSISALPIADVTGHLKLANVEPEFEPTGFYDQSLVALCPICWGEYSHQNWCAAFGRIGGEDGDSHLSLITDGEWEGIDPGLNPSSRRHGLRIAIDGECGHRWYLTIAQHKGQTLIGYEVELILDGDDE